LRLETQPKARASHCRAYLGGAGVNPSRLRPGSGLGLGFGAFLTSFLPLSLLPMRRSVTQKGRVGKDKNCMRTLFPHCAARRHRRETRGKAAGKPAYPGLIPGLIQVPMIQVPMTQVPMIQVPRASCVSPLCVRARLQSCRKGVVEVWALAPEGFNKKANEPFMKHDRVDCSGFEHC